MPKRKKGTKARAGSFSTREREEKDGTKRWECRAYVRRVDGTKERRSFFGKTEADAVAKAEAEIEKSKKGLPAKSGEVSLADYLDAWIKDTAPMRARSAATLDGYQRAIDNHVRDEIGKVALQNLLPEHVAHVLTKMDKAGLAPRTQRYILAVLRVALKPAERDGRLVRNPARLVDGPTVRRKPVTPLTTAETAKLLEHLGDDVHGRVLTVAATCGMRIGEVLGLQRDAVSLDAGTLVVKTALQQLPGKAPVLVTPKTGDSQRVIHLPASAVRALRAQLELPAAPEPWASLLFTRPKEQRRAPRAVGTPLSRKAVWDHLQRALARAGLGHKRVHDLRHGAASIHLDAGASMVEVSNLLGHSGIQVTIDTYGHLTDAARARMASRMDAALASGSRGGQKRGSGRAAARGRKAAFRSR